MAFIDMLEKQKGQSFVSGATSAFSSAAKARFTALTNTNIAIETIKKLTSVLTNKP